MIASISEEYGYVSTEGCGCCSCELEFGEIEKIKTELIENIEITLKVCEKVGIDYTEIEKIALENIAR